MKSFKEFIAEASANAKPVEKSDIDDFLAKLQKMINDHFAKNLSNLTPPTMTAQYGSKNVKIVRNEPHGAGRSVYCFIDKSNGDILKAAGWASPAKHARGNIFDPDFMKTSLSPYGAAYLRM